MSGNDLADEVWRAMASLVIDNRDGWRRAAVEQTGLPFSRIRILKRLSRQPMTVKQVAHAAAMDAPATTVAVNDLEDRGLVVRETDPTNRRCKVVSLTDAGREMVRKIDTVDDPAPNVLAALDDAELKELKAIIDTARGIAFAVANPAISQPWLLARGMIGRWRNRAAPAAPNRATAPGSAMRAARLSRHRPSHAEYKQVTVLFADVVRSMDIAAALGAERLREVMGDLFDRSSKIVQRYGGTVDKFTGDGIMAVFGAPHRTRGSRGPGVPRGAGHPARYSQPGDRCRAPRPHHATTARRSELRRGDRR